MKYFIGTVRVYYQNLSYDETFNVYTQAQDEYFALAKIREAYESMYSSQENPALVEVTFYHFID